MKEILKDHKGKESSKRVFGVLCMIIGTLFRAALGVVSFLMRTADSATILSVSDGFFMAGCALLGIGVVEFFGSLKK